jgi:hypothetical protein
VINLPRKRTHEDFIKEVFDLVGNEYEILGTFTKMTVKVEAFHNICGEEILITPKTFINNGSRCSICADNTKMTYEHVKDYIEGNSGCKLLSTEYHNSKAILSLQCSCGNKFATTFSYFKHENKRQCNDCGHENNINSQKHDYGKVKSIIESADCILVSKEYVNNSTPMDIICSKGHSFSKRFSDFNPDSPCPQCSNEKKSEDSRYSYEYVKEFIENENYRLLSSNYRNNRHKLLLLCNSGHEFSMPFGSFSAGQRCPKCNISKGEKKIRDYLTKNNYNLKEQLTFDKCKYKKLLPFDFAILDKNNEVLCLVEYDGKQHFEPVEHFGGEKSFTLTKIRDAIKNKFCELNNIRLLRIPYYNFDHIDGILFNYLKDFSKD